MDKLLLKNAYEINEILNKNGIPESERSLFVGVCLLALKNGLNTLCVSNDNIISQIKEITHTNINLQYNLGEIIPYIETKLYSFITSRYDLLNLYYTIFNKYAGKSNKNQAFTPYYIIDFIIDCLDIKETSKVLDPNCGSSSFLIASKSKNVYGIELEKVLYDISLLNLQINDLDTTNIINGNCFDYLQWIKDNDIEFVLMNPPYNSPKSFCYNEYTKQWKTTVKEDPSKGFHFVYEIANQMTKGKLAVILPLQCAIGTDSVIEYFKIKMLEKHHLNAVFSLPNDLFYPSASVNVCCMIFDIGIPHTDETFFGYFKEEGFIKRKNIGRIEKEEGNWKNNIKPLWMDAYKNKKSIPGLSVTHYVTGKDEWLCEAYMETDYSKLTEKDFQKTINEYFAYLIKEDLIDEF